MNKAPKSNKQKKNSEKTRKIKIKSTPLVKETNQYSLPEDSEELDEKLENFIDEKELDYFNHFLSKCGNLLTEKFLKSFLKKLIEKYNENPESYLDFLKCFIKFIKDPNIILDESKEESLLMFSCGESNYKMIACLCQKEIELNVNYKDKSKRNALFYLKGGSDDKNIIELLIKKKININNKDNDGNTALHNAIINKSNFDLIYNLIDIGNADFMIKNKENKSSLELINSYLISKKESDTNSNIFNFREINKLIQLIKKKLTIQSASNILLKSIDLNLSSQSQNLFKIPSFSFNKNINLKETSKNNEDDLLNNIYLQLKQNPSIIIDTQNQFNDKKINNLTFSQKLEYYKQMNRNKKMFLNFLKTSENYLVENAKKIKNTLEEKKKELKNKKNELNTKIQLFNEKNDEFNNNIKNTILGINQINEQIKQVINEINGNESNLIKMNYQLSNTKKYQFKTKDDSKYYNYIYNQLTIDLIDYKKYIDERNKQLDNSITQIHKILQNIVKDCLGNNYEARIYGSRATGMSLPRSDIDFVIVRLYNLNELYKPLDILYEYLITLSKTQNFIKVKNYYPKTSVPIIKMETSEKYHNISFDISMEMPSNQGEKCIDYIKQRVKEFEPLTAMTLALKTIFYEAKINEPYKGGLSSYGIILLIIYFLKNERKKGKIISYNNIGKLFFGLLSFYKERKNVNKPINIEESTYSYFSLFDPENSLIIVDPLNPGNNVAKNVRQLNFLFIDFLMNYYNVSLL